MGIGYRVLPPEIPEKSAGYSGIGWVGANRVQNPGSESGKTYGMKKALFVWKTAFTTYGIDFLFGSRIL